MTVLLLLAATWCQAQSSVGVRGGLNFSQALVQSNGSRLDGKFRPGAVAGLYADFPLVPLFYIQPSLQYEMKGGKDKATAVKTTLGYITLPVDLLFKPAASGLFAGAGPYAAYAVSGKQSQGNQSPVEAPLFKGDHGLNRWDGGAHFQLGYAFRSGPQVALHAETGLLNLSKHESGSSRQFHNFSLGATLGYDFGK